MCEHYSMQSLQDFSFQECETYQIVPHMEIIEKWGKTDETGERLADFFMVPEGQIYPLGSVPYNEIRDLISAGLFILKSVQSEGTSDMIAFIYEGHRIEIQPYSEGGWDYTYYRKDGSEWDGGIYDDDSASRYLVLSEIIWDIKKCGKNC